MHMMNKVLPHIFASTMPSRNLRQCQHYTEGEKQNRNLRKKRCKTVEKLFILNETSVEIFCGILMSLTL